MRQFPRVTVSRSGRLARFTFPALVFRARPGGPVLAAAVLQLYGCEWVDLTVGTREYALGNPGGARSTATQVLKAARVSWALPPD